MPLPIDATPAAPVLCFGEILWDCLPSGRFPGGAPFNVAYHLSKLCLRPLVVSAVGEDELGDALLKQLSAWGLELGGIHRHAGWATGTVQARISPQGDAHYEIRREVAWDLIPLSIEAAQAARSARALVFGSLAQRSVVNRLALRTLLGALPADAECVFDVNLRAPHDDLALVHELATAATLLKLNAAEAARLIGERAHLTEKGLAIQLSSHVGCRSVCITAGGRGAGLLHEGKWFWENARPVQVADTVGAGDAFLAAFLAARLRGESPATCLAQACRLGEWVASQRGATPPHPGAAGKFERRWRRA